MGTEIGLTPSNMEIDLLFYIKNSNNKWIYDLMDHLMFNLETINALASMACNVDLNAYKLHPRDEYVFNDFVDEG